MYSLKLVTAPTSTPISMPEAKDHCRIDPDVDEEDSLIESMVYAATEIAENELKRRLITQTWDFVTDKFPCDSYRSGLDIKLSTIQSITSVQYYDSTNTLQTYTDYEVDLASIRPTLYPTYPNTWPLTYTRLNAVQVRAVVGFGTAAEVPKTIRQWILCAIASMYENRELATKKDQLAISPFIDGLLDPYRIVEI